MSKLIHYEYMRAANIDERLMNLECSMKNQEVKGDCKNLFK